MSNLADLYQEKVLPQLLKEFGLKNQWQAPRLKKVVVNIGLGEAIEDKAILDKAAETLAVITGQRPKVTQARKAISSFKLRKGMPIGLAVTLRREKMYFFLEKLFKIVLPRLRDFQGVPLKGFDAHGNYSLGLTEQIVFPEVDYEKIDKIRGLQITIVTETKDPQQSLRLLALLGMPFEKAKEEVK